MALPPRNYSQLCYNIQNDGIVEVGSQPRPLPAVRLRQPVRGDLPLRPLVNPGSIRADCEGTVIVGRCSQFELIEQ